MTRYYAVQDVDTGEILPGIPTPRLISNYRAEAYFVDADNPRYPGDGIWYMKDTGYQSKDGTYRTVRVIRDPASLEEESRLYGHLKD